MNTNTVEVRVGRLLEIRVAMGHRNIADVEEMFRAISSEMAKEPARRLVIVTDWRRCPLMDGQAAERLMQNMSANNARVERSAALASYDAPTAVMQFARLIRESNFAHRKIFMQPHELIAWLDQVLDPDEQKRLREFLAER
jgi:precorrin isomerase